jgi:peptide/nickel transport system substrate-binding protein
MIRWKFLCYSTLLLILLFGCKTNDRIQHQSDALIIGADSPATNLDPRIGIDKASEDLHHLLFNGLVRKDENDRMVPDLALSYEKVNPLLYRFRLRRGIRFHDGRILDAVDVAYTYASVLNGSLNTTKKATLAAVETVRAVETDVVEVVLRQPFNGLIFNLNIGIVPRGSPIDFGENPIGTGPYRLISFRPDEGAKLEAYSGYFGKPAKIRFVEIRVIPDATTRVLELQRGSIDLIFGASVIPPDYFRILRKDARFRTESRTGNNYAYIGFNTKDAILSKPKVREAIGYAIDRDRIMKHLLDGEATPATGILAPHNWCYEGNVVKLDYDPQKARTLLEEAGFPDPDGDGPRSRFQLTYKISTSEIRRTVATVLQQNLAQVGIDLKIRSYEWGTFFADINHGNFQMCNMMWVGISDPDIFRNVFATDGRWNRGKYSNSMVDEWVAKAQQSQSEAEEKQYYSLVQKKVAEDAPYISLWYESNVAVMRKELEGMRLTPDADHLVLKDVYWAR